MTWQLRDLKHNSGQWRREWQSRRGRCQQVYILFFVLAPTRVCERSSKRHVFCHRRIHNTSGICCRSLASKAMIYDGPHRLPLVTEAARQGV
jgi:hypothetical protein